MPKNALSRADETSGASLSTWVSITLVKYGRYP